MTPFLLVVIAIVGLVVGSFLNVCIGRLPLGESVAFPRSRCPSCRRPIAWYDNLPVLSYVVLGGRCRSCQASISIRYPLVEIATAVLFVIAGFFFAPDLPLLTVRLIFTAALVVLFGTDLETQRLPNVITLPGIVVGLAFSLLLPPGIRSAVIGVLVGGGILWLIGEAYYRYAGEEGMGGGDVKMLAMIGAFLGWKLAVLTLVFSSLAGSIVGLIVLASRRGGMKYALPYGTFLAIAALVASLFGDQIVAWYTGLYQL